MWNYRRNLLFLICFITALKVYATPTVGDIQNAELMFIVFAGVAIISGVLFFRSLYAVTLESSVQQSRTMSFILMLIFLIVTIGAGWKAREHSWVYFRKPNYVRHVRMDMRSMTTVLESYFVDHSSYPLYGTEFYSINAGINPRKDLYNLPSFRIWINEDEKNQFHLVTTPVAYVTDIFKDPFSERKEGHFTYYTDGDGWIMTSPGPDGIYDIDPRLIYDSSVAQPSMELQTGTNVKGRAYTYDPTNGAKSPGDLYRVKQ